MEPGAKKQVIVKHGIDDEAIKHHGMELPTAGKDLPVAELLVWSLRLGLLWVIFIIGSSLLPSGQTVSALKQNVASKVDKVEQTKNGVIDYVRGSLIEIIDEIEVEQELERERSQNRF